MVCQFECWVLCPHALCRYPGDGRCPRWIQGCRTALQQTDGYSPHRLAVAVGVTEKQKRALVNSALETISTVSVFFVFLFFIFSQNSILQFSDSISFTVASSHCDNPENVLFSKFKSHTDQRPETKNQAAKCNAFSGHLLTNYELRQSKALNFLICLYISKFLQHSNEQESPLLCASLGDEVQPSYNSLPDSL